MRQQQAADSAFGAWGLIVCAWLASLAPLPWFFCGLAGYFMASSGRLTLMEVGGSVIGPGVALVALLAAFFWCHRSPMRLAAMAVPGLLVLVELGFTVVAWIGK